MNKITLALISLFFLNLNIWNAAPSDSREITVCHVPATEQFAAFSEDAEFRRAHKDPTPLNFHSEEGKTISFDTPDGKKGSGYAFENATKTKNYLFVIHEWYGLNGHIKSEAEKLFNDLENINVIALDIYDGKVADNGRDAGKLMQAVKTERAEAIINGAMAHAGTDAKIYTIGWCFGGSWSLQASLLAKDQAAGCVVYYGMPEKDVNKLKNLGTDVLGIWAAKERWINPTVVAQFEADMKAAGKELSSNSYEAGHGFANPSNPVYDAESSADAYAKTLTFLKSRMK
ncbi:MAG: dienelactone hydrolase family protein [Roseivirga sp.]|nr:dienelactone hydrolase family protein [Roseivirga sp.]